MFCHMISRIAGYARNPVARIIVRNDTVLRLSTEAGLSVNRLINRTQEIHPPSTQYVFRFPYASFRLQSSSSFQEVR
jgi:hypothetical protein